MNLNNKLYKLTYYKKSNGKYPFAEWLDKIKDYKTKAIVHTRLDRACLGNLGDYKLLGDGVFELRINYGAGIRIYIGFTGEDIILLLLGGDKKTQDKDIFSAKTFFNDYKKRNKIKWKEHTTRT